MGNLCYINGHANGLWLLLIIQILVNVSSIQTATICHSTWLQIVVCGVAKECRRREPNELSRLVTADNEGRCMVVPFQIEQKVQHSIKGWRGKVKEIVWNKDGLIVYVVCDEVVECVRPDELIPV